MFAILAAVSAGCTASRTTAPLADNGTVVRVIDGDTIELSLGSTVETVRLLGVDTPETVARDRPVQCFGPEASKALAGLLPAGTTLRIERDVESRDHYGRLLLYLWREDGLFVNEWLVANGFAETLFIEPNMAYATQLSKQRDAAYANQIGLWGACEGPDQPLASSE